MAGTAFPFLFTLLLLVRWLLLPEAQACRRWAPAVLGGVQGLLCGLFFEGSWDWALLTLSQVALPVIMLTAYEGRMAAGREAAGVRLWLLVAFVAPSLVWCGMIAPPAWLGIVHTVIPEVAWIWAAGALLATKESNVFVRWFFQRLKSTMTKEEQKNRDETGNGRVIGALERLLVYVFLVGGHTLAVPVIVAVKALARFRRMEDDQAFAEYVIVGTFLSILLALTCYGWTVWAAV
jgi:hypothetical protein